MEALGQCVVRLEEKIVLLEHHRVSCDGVIEEKYLKTINFNRETSKEPLIWRQSLGVKCDECNYVGRNAGRILKHKEIDHVHDCEPCKSYCVGDSAFASHNSLVHIESLWTDIEYESLTSGDICDIKTGPETLRRTDLLDKICSKDQKEKEEARRSRREKLEKEKLDRKE